jgi:hypothetical protein
MGMDQQAISLPRHLGPDTSWDRLSQFLIVATQTVLARSCLVHRGASCVVWRQDDVLHRLSLRPYTWPDRWTPTAPRSVRFNVNYHEAGPWLTRRKIATLWDGAGPVRWGDRLQWSVLPEEADATVHWLLAVVEGRHRGDADLPAPPYPAETWAAPLQHVDYGWSVAALAAVDEHEREQAGRRVRRAQATITPAESLGLFKS